MSRSARLLKLIQHLRRHRRPVTAAAIAADLEVSPRTVYRDIGELVAQGAPIEGEAGFGYVLRPGFFLPPLMFQDEEIEAVALGLRWVTERGDPALSRAARDALAKIASALPADLKERIETSGLYAVPGAEPRGSVDLAMIRRAIREELKLRVTYVNGAGERMERTLWPLALALFDGYRMIPAWCELRGDFRNFRTDRIVEAGLGERYPGRRRALLAAWRDREGLADDSS